MGLSRSEIFSVTAVCSLDVAPTKFNPVVPQVPHIHMVKDKPLFHDIPVQKSYTVWALQGERSNFYVQRTVEEAGLVLMVRSNTDLHSVLCSLEISCLA